MGTSSKRSRSAAARTCSAVTTETSCSTLLPPKMRPRRRRSGISEALTDQRHLVLQVDAERVVDALLGESHERGDVRGGGAAGVDEEVAVLGGELGAADAVAAQADGVEELPGGLRGAAVARRRVLEEGAGVAAARLRLETALVEVGDAGAEGRGVARPEGELGPEDGPAGEPAAGEGAAAVDEAELVGGVFGLFAIPDGDALEHVGQAAAVGPGVVNDGAADAAGDAAGPLQPGVAGEGMAK